VGVLSRLFVPVIRRWWIGPNSSSVLKVAVDEAPEWVHGFEKEGEGSWVRGIQLGSDGDVTGELEHPLVSFLKAVRFLLSASSAETRRGPASRFFFIYLKNSLLVCSSVRELWGAYRKPDRFQGDPSYSGGPVSAEKAKYT